MQSLHPLVGRAAIGAVALLAVVCGPAVAQEMPAPTLVVGDSWSYREIDLLTKNETGRLTETVTAVTPSEYWIDARRAARYWWRGDPAKSAHREMFAYFEGAPEKRGKSLSTNDGGCAYPWPLKVGATYECSERSVQPNGWKLRHDLKWTVEGAESVETAAGRYETLRLVGKGFIANDTTGGPPSRNERIVWLAPAVKREVKHELRIFLPNGQIFKAEGRELLSFKAGS